MKAFLTGVAYAAGAVFFGLAALGAVRAGDDAVAIVSTVIATFLALCALSKRPEQH